MPSNLGFPVPLALTHLQGSLLAETYQDGITATAGGTQATSVQLYAETSRIATVANIGDGVILPPSTPGLDVVIINSGGKAITVFGNGTDTIDGNAATVGVSQMTGSTTFYECVTKGAWYTEGIGTGYSGSLPTVSFTDAAAAAGTNAATATAITTVITRVATNTATGGVGVTLPTAVPGLQITVSNTSANTLTIYAAGSDLIYGTGTTTAGAASVTVATLKTATFFSTAPLTWHYSVSA